MVLYNVCTAIFDAYWFIRWLVTAHPDLFMWYIVYTLIMTSIVRIYYILIIYLKPTSIDMDFSNMVFAYIL